MYLRIALLLTIIFNFGECYSESNAASINAPEMLQEQPLPLREREAVLKRDYHIEDVAFASDNGKIHLAGELTRPYGKGPFPAIVMITGSGPQDRNQMIAGHRPFLILSDFLVKKGFAVLRYDDRGVGKSTGDFKSAIVPDFATDAANAMKWLQARSYIDKSLTGYLGHSEGGIVAPLAAQQTPAKFLILLAAPAFPLGDIFMQGEELRIQTTVTFDEQSKRSMERFNAFFETIKTSKTRKQGFVAGKKKLIELGETKQMATGLANTFTLPHFYWAIKYDPSTALDIFQGPVLAVYASEDTKILPAVNAAKMKAHLKNNVSKIVTVPGNNHLFQSVEVGSKKSYQDNKNSFSDSSLEYIGQWLEQELKRSYLNEQIN